MEERKRKGLGWSEWEGPARVAGETKFDCPEERDSGPAVAIGHRHNIYAPFMSTLSFNVT